MKKLTTFLLVLACVIPTIMNINVTVNNRISIYKSNKDQ